MTIASFFALFTAMIALALVPGPTVLIVVSRTLSLGLKQGLITVLGMLCADFIFILLAIFSLSALADFMGSFFIIIKYLGAAYLIWLGIKMITQPDRQRYAPTKISHSGSFFSGLITTLGNPKAILFYASFLPAFLDLKALAIIDIVIIFAIATLAIGGITAIYAYLATKTKASLKTTKHLKYGSGGLFIGGGAFLALRN